MDCLESTDISSTGSIQYYKLLLKVATMIPITHLIIGCACIFTTTLYFVLEFHLFEDFFHGGSAVTLTYNPASHVYRNVVSKCSILHGRYVPVHMYITTSTFQYIIYMYYMYKMFDCVYLQMS